MIQVLSTEISQSAIQPLTPFVVPADIGDGRVSFAELLSKQEQIESAIVPEKVDLTEPEHEAEVETVVEDSEETAEFDAYLDIPVTDGPLPSSTETPLVTTTDVPSPPDRSVNQRANQIEIDPAAGARRDTRVNAPDVKAIQIVKTTSAEARIQGMIASNPPVNSAALAHVSVRADTVVLPEAEPVLAAVPDIKPVAEPARPNAAHIPAPQLPTETGVKVSHQVATALVQQRDQLTEITLDPPELGKVKFQMATTENTAQVVLSAERPETGDLLRRHVEQLARELADLGYSDVQFQFASDRQNQGGATPPDTVKADTTETSETAPPTPMTVITGLDLRI